jgi:hypothetical protein
MIAEAAPKIACALHFLISEPLGIWPVLQRSLVRKDSGIVFLFWGESEPRRPWILALASSVVETYRFSRLGRLALESAEDGSALGQVYAGNDQKMHGIEVPSLSDRARSSCAMRSPLCTLSAGPLRHRTSSPSTVSLHK